MTEDFSFDFNDIRPRTWGDAFPWLRGAASDLRDQWWYSPIGDADPITRRARLAELSGLALNRLTRWKIGEIFPGLNPDLHLLRLNLPTQAVRALGRHGCEYAAALMSMTIDDLLDWKNVGVGTIDAILQSLGDASTLLATPTVTAEGGKAAVTLPEASFDQVRLPDWMLPAIEDLNQIARWYATIGLPGQTVLGGSLPAEAPDEIAKARQRLETISANDVLDEDALELDIAALFDDALGLLDPRAARILAERLFADTPMTLDELGRVHGVTRERIRQIEGKARGHMLSVISEEGPLVAVAIAARDFIGTIRPLDELIAVFPALSRTVELAEQPAWRVLDRLDDAYEIDESWCVVPTMTEVEQVTHTRLQEIADEYGVAHVSDVNLVQSSRPEALTELTKSWLSHCNYMIDGDVVLTRTQRVQDYGAAILSIAGTPLSAQDIIDRFVMERSAGSLRNAMSTDDRFERVDRDRWALKEWGLDAYDSIRNVIRRIIGESGGRVSLDHLVETITGRYTVAASSVIAYAAAPPFETRDGYVQLASGNRDVRKAPEGTRRLFRRLDAWAYRVRITADHLRGSGSVAPAAIATICDLQHGQTRHLESDLGPQTVAWTGLQPSFGTIRRFLIDQDVAAYTEAFLVLNDNGRFAFEQMRELSGTALADALTLIGAPSTFDVHEARAALIAALGLPAASPISSIIGAYRERGDSDIAELLTTARTLLETEHKPEQKARSANVDEILDLL